MNKFAMNMQIEVDVRDVVYSLSMLGYEQAIEVIKGLEQSFADWELTEKLTKHFMSEMTSLYKDPNYSTEEPEDKQAWIVYLQSQIDALK